MNWLKNYLFYNKNNEAPALFHIFSGLSVLASVVSRRVRIEQGYFTYYPNLYTVMVGDPGGGKSTALDVAKAFVRSMKIIPIAADATTTQALLRHMSEEGSPCKRSFKEGGVIIEYTPMTIFAGELINFMGMDPYGWVTFLTTVYHEHIHEVKTKNKGDDLIKGPFINLLGCLTPDTTVNLLQQRIISSGFARRCIFVWGNGRGEPIAFPEITDEQKKAMQECLEWAQQLQKVHGVFKWSPEARAWYEPWYVNLRKNMHKVSTPVTAGYFESKHVQLMKVAMLVALSESTELILKIEHFQIALQWLEATEKDLEKVFSGSGRNAQSGVAEKILSLLESANEPIPLKRLKGLILRDSPLEEQDKVLHYLQATEKIIAFEHHIDKKYMGTYVGTPDSIKAFRENHNVKGIVIDQP